MPRSRLSLLGLAGLLAAGCAKTPTPHQAYLDAVAGDLASLPPAGPPLAERDLTRLPEPVQRYLRQARVLGKPLPRSMRVTFDARMRRKPGDPGMRARSVQVNVFDPPSRSFYMGARMAGLPVRVLHRYAGEEASMRVRVLGRFDRVDIHSHDLFKAECVTVLNDLCLMAPGRLADPRLGWKALDAERAEVTFTNHGLAVKAVLHINAAGELVNFVSDDRLALQPDNTLKSFRFSTPLDGYKDFGAARLGTDGRAIYDYPEGPFEYGSFTLKSVAYDISPAQAADTDGLD